MTSPRPTTEEGRPPTGYESWADYDADVADAAIRNRCASTAGRCEKESGHDGDHYTEYRDPVWSHVAAPPSDQEEPPAVTWPLAGPAPTGTVIPGLDDGPAASTPVPALDRNLLAEAIFEAGVRQTMIQSEQAADNILAELELIAARPVEEEK